MPNTKWIKNKIILGTVILSLGLSACQFNTDSNSSSSTPPTPASTGDTFIPLVAILYSKPNFQGQSRVLYKNMDNLNSMTMNDAAQSMRIYQGPNFDQWQNEHPGTQAKISLCTDQNYQGQCRSYSLGAYDQLENSQTSSVQFMSQATPSQLIGDSLQSESITQIHTLCRLYSDKNYGGSFVEVLGTNAPILRAWSNLDSALGTFQASSIYCVKGPNWSNGHGISFYKNPSWTGDGLHLGCRNEASGYVICDQLSSMQTSWNDAIHSSKSF